MITGLVIFMFWDLDFKVDNRESGFSVLILALFVLGIIQDFCLIYLLTK